jgi:uncharacterized repeat protein (TIGR01451 family)
MNRKHLWGAPLLAACGLVVALLAAPAAQSASVTPQEYEKNPSCADFGYTTITKFDPPNSGTKDGITLIRVDGSHIDWTSTVAVDAVLVKGADGGNLYEYPADTFADEDLVTPVNSSGGPAGLSHVEFCTDGQGEPGPEPGIDIEKAVDKTVAYPGETLNYTLTVTNTGNTTLAGVDLTDELCDSDPVRSGANAGDAVFDAGDVWTYTCSYVVPSGTSEVENVATVCYESSTPPVEVPAAEKCDSDTVVTPVEQIGIVVVKDAVETTAVAGSTVHFTISVTNTGTTTFVSYEFTDAECDEVRTGANAADTEFNPGDVWTYECAMATQAGQQSAVNNATAKGTDENGREAQGQDGAVIPLTQPETPTGNTPGGSTPGGSTPEGGGTLPETIASGRARLRGPSGCVKQAFRARVTGRSIASVAFYVDGRLAKKFTGTRASYAYKVHPRRYGLGRHRVVARVTFVAGSGTEPRTLRLTFRRCARGTVAPRFTG